MTIEVSSTPVQGTTHGSILSIDRTQHAGFSDRNSTNDPRSDAGHSLPEKQSPEMNALVDSSLREALQGLRNGEITITVHNGEIVQIDRIAKMRQFKSRYRSHS